MSADSPPATASQATSPAPRGTAEDAAARVRVGERVLGPDDLAYLNRMTTVGLVLPSVAHDLNNALQVVSGLVEMLGFRTDLPTDAQDKIARIGAQSARASQVIRDLVTFARRDDAGVTLVDVVKTAEDALTFRRYHLARARITVAVTGAVRGEALARLDGSQLRQVLLNLIINAEQSLAGRNDGQLEIRITPSKNGIVLRVADNGTGLPDGVAERALQPFFTTKAAAAGLGLTVADALARGLGGTLTLEGGQGGGTIATLTLPATPGDQPQRLAADRPNAQG